MEHLLWTVHCSSHFAGRNWLSLTTAQEVSYTMSSQYRRGIWLGEKLSDLGMESGSTLHSCVYKNNLGTMFSP